MNVGNLPLGSWTATGYWSILSLFAVIVGALLAALQLKPARRKEEDEGEKEKRKSTFKRVAMVVGLASLVILVILENFLQPAAWLNQFTLIFLALLVLEVALLLVHKIRMVRKAPRKQPTA